VAFAPANNTAAAAAAPDPVTFVVTSSPHGITSTGFNSPITVPGLRAGVAYTFTVQAEIQDLSRSEPSFGSVAVTPGCSTELSDAPCGNGSGVCVAANSSSNSSGNSSSNSGSASVYAAQCLCYAGYTGEHCESALATGDTTSANATATSATGTTAPAAVVRLTADDMPAEPCKEGRLCSYQITFRLLASAFPDQSVPAGEWQLVAYLAYLIIHHSILYCANALCWQCFNLYASACQLFVLAWQQLPFACICCSINIRVRACVVCADVCVLVHVARLAICVTKVTCLLYINHFTMYSLHTISALLTPPPRGRRNAPVDALRGAFTTLLVSDITRALNGSAANTIVLSAQPRDAASGGGMDIRYVSCCFYTY
jgi:hypothetical protein